MTMVRLKAPFLKVVSSIERHPRTKRVAHAVGLSGALGIMRSRASRMNADTEHANLHLLLAFLLARDANCIDVGRVLRCLPEGHHPPVARGFAPGLRAHPRSI